MMTQRETDNGLGQTIRNYKETMQQRTCIRQRLQRHADAFHGAGSAFVWQESGFSFDNAKDAVSKIDIEEAMKNLALMIEVELRREALEKDLTDYGHPEVIRGHKGR